MALHRTVPVSSRWLLLVLAVCACMPASAHATTPPVLQSPVNGASSFVEGDSMTFRWSGTLQGDPDTLTRAYYRLEIASAADVPAGAQTEWTEVENYVVTEPGEAVTSATLGVPAAGSHKWRVCLWGVVDDVVANEIQQLPGGCSSTRAFTSKVAASSRGSIGTLPVEERTQVAGEVRKVYVTRPGTTTTAPTTTSPVTPVTTSPDPIVDTQPQDEVVADAVFQPLRGLDSSERGVSSVGLGSQGLTAEPAASREGIGGSIASALSMTLPFLPIPFWVLALLLMCLPMAHLWRRSTLGMFDWPDGSVNGYGDMPKVDDDLAAVQVATALKNDSKTTDGAAPAPVQSPSAPDRGRRSA